MLNQVREWLFWRGVRAARIVPWVPLNLPMTFNSRTRLLRWFGCDLHPSARIEMGAILIGRNLRCAANAYVNTGVFIDALNTSVVIGDHVHVGPGAKLLTDSHRIGDVGQRAGTAISLPVVIGDGAWIGAGAIVLPGVSVAVGCVIGAGAVVTRDTEPNGLYVGAPAIRVRDFSIPIEH